jgi:hypothetical protein
MNNYVDKIQTCISSTHLGKRHQILIGLINDTIPILNQEIGEIGAGAIHEILEIQNRYESRLSKDLLPFSSQTDSCETNLYVTLGELDNNGQSYPIGILAETSRRCDWSYLGWDGMESMPYDVRGLSRKAVAIAAKRLAVGILILDEVFHEPNSTLSNLAKELEKSNLLETCKE